MEIAQNVQVWYRESTNQWIIESNISVDGSADSVCRYICETKPDVKTVKYFKNHHFDDFYITYLLEDNGDE